jgi:hypothetical protein
MVFDFFATGPGSGTSSRNPTPAAIAARPGTKNAGAPAPQVHQRARDDRREGEPEVAPQAVPAERHAEVLGRGDQHRDAHRVVDRGEHPREREARGDLPRRGGEAGEEKRRADAEEEHRDHLVAAPVVGEPAGRNGERAEGDEPAERQGQELGIRPVPLARECQDHRRENQHDEMVEQVPEIDERYQPGLGSHAVLRIAHGTKLTP